jgi:hypothetical protein
MRALPCLFALLSGDDGIPAMRRSLTEDGKEVASECDGPLDVTECVGF